MALSDCPPSFRIVKLGNPDAERNAINAALQAIVRCLGEGKLPSQAGHAGEFLQTNGSSLLWAAGGAGTPTGTGFTHITSGVQDGAAKLVNLTAATDVAANQGTTTTVLHGNAAGQPSFGAVSLSADVSGTLPIANGGSGQTTANAALNAFLPSQATHSGKVLQTDGTNTSWAAKATGTVTSVGVSGNNGISVSGSPITTSGTFTLGLGAITPTSVSTGNLTASSTVSLPNASITDAMLRNSAGLSVIGRPAASSGAPSDIVSTGARTFLASSAANTAVTFRAIDTADFPTGDWIGANNGTSYASASTALTADTTWFATGASVTLAAGTYLVTSFAQGFMRTTASTAAVTTRLFNVTDATAITSSECCILWDTAAVRRAQTGSVTLIITVGASKSIRLEASRLAGGAYTVSPTILNDTVGRSGITYVRIA